MKIRSRKQDEPELNLTPMIDVVFQLLIFFMVATTFLDPEHEIDIELPEASSNTVAAAESGEIVINVFADGRIVVSEQDLDVEGLLAQLRTAAASDPQTAVTIRGDRLVHHQHIVAVMDACGRAGLLNLSVGTIEGA